ncbi:GPP34 family phosphoprotein [Floricoccus penangensis]|uniref:GPP34 family phosphoprotein n=1 Tax=Floricoccus penangensis TaxID=1859475 RepID=UPI00203F8128|nr:GPP34 family phosphoprotein [Floricoccus penangensis]URZ88063.1 GPP34 family phosphoprotein [Floricoccus penangensis]
MSDLSITQQYYICALNDHGVIPSSYPAISGCIVAGSLLDMQLEDCIQIEKKVVLISGLLSERLWYLKPLYDYINQSKPVKLSEIVQKFSFTSKKNSICELIMTSLKDKNLGKSSEVGIIFKKEAYIPRIDVISEIIGKIRSELLENGNLSHEVIILTILLQNSGLIKKYFSKFEQKELKSKTKEFKNSDENIFVKDIVNQINMVMSSTNSVIYMATMM